MTDFNPENPIVDILMAAEESPNWLVKDFLLQGTMSCIAGEPGAGKSYLTYTIALALGAGHEALGGIIPAGEPKRVIYFDEENSAGDKEKYLRRSYFGLFRSGDGPDLSNLQDNFWPVHFHLGGPDWMDRAAEWVEFVNPHLIVFDTATPCFNIQDENSNAEATQVIKDVRRLMRMTDPVASSIILRHAKINAEKGGRRTMRGAKAWQSAADAVMFQVRNPGRPRKHNLQLTRLVPDKTRAYGLTETIFITPKYTDEDKTGLVLSASFDANSEHKKALAEESEDDE